MGREYIRHHDMNIPTKIHQSHQFYPYFKDCLGAIDNTHIPAWVPVTEQVKFCNRKGIISQNILAVVGFDMRFHYVLTGWEGSATNSGVLYSTLDHISDPFVIPQGKYYLANGGYPNILGFLTPYRGHRYHLSEFNLPGARTIRITEELFSHRHSSLCNNMERTFSLLK
ncbi:unnamed protein product [Victoria cruziana]